MTIADRRLEIIGILAVSGHATSRELAQELGVSSGTILHDLIHLSYGYPIYTKQGAGGGIFIMDHYKPYVNTLTFTELEWLKGKYDAAAGRTEISNITPENLPHLSTSVNYRQDTDGHTPMAHQ